MRSRATRSSEGGPGARRQRPAIGPGRLGEGSEAGCGRADLGTVALGLQGLGDGLAGDDPGVQAPELDDPGPDPADDQAGDAGVLDGHEQRDDAAHRVADLHPGLETEVVGQGGHVPGHDRLAVVGRVVRLVGAAVAAGVDDDQPEPEVDQPADDPGPYPVLTTVRREPVVEDDRAALPRPPVEGDAGPVEGREPSRLPLLHPRPPVLDDRSVGSAALPGIHRRPPASLGGMHAAVLVVARRRAGQARGHRRRRRRPVVTLVLGVGHHQARVRHRPGQLPQQDRPGLQGQRRLPGPVRRPGDAHRDHDGRGPHRRRALHPGGHRAVHRRSTTR